MAVTFGVLPDGNTRSGRMKKQFNRRLFFAVAHELGEHGRWRRVRRAKRRGGELMRTSQCQESGLGRGAGEYGCSEWAWRQIAPGISSSSTPAARTGRVRGREDRRRGLGGRERGSEGARDCPQGGASGADTFPRARWWGALRQCALRQCALRQCAPPPWTKGDTWLRQRRERVRTGS